MSKEILLINARKGKKKITRKGKKKMPRKAKKRAAPKTRTRTVTKIKYRTRSKAKRNPSRARRAARAVGGRTGRSLMGLLTLRNLFDAAQGTTGMLAAQYAAKKWGGLGGGDHDREWTPRHYLMGGLGSLGAGLVAEMVRSGSGKKMFTGGLSLLGFNLVTKQLASRSDDVHAMFAGTGQTFRGDDGNIYRPGDTYMGEDGEVFIMGEGGGWSPMGYMGGVPTEADFQDLGRESLTPPGHLGAYDEFMGAGDPYVDALTG